MQFVDFHFILLDNIMSSCYERNIFCIRSAEIVKISIKHHFLIKEIELKKNVDRKNEKKK
jgi:hypothetical protein